MQTPAAPPFLFPIPFITCTLTILRAHPGRDCRAFDVSRSGEEARASVCFLTKHEEFSMTTIGELIFSDTMSDAEAQGTLCVYRGAYGWHICIDGVNLDPQGEVTPILSIDTFYTATRSDGDDPTTPTIRVHVIDATVTDTDEDRCAIVDWGPGWCVTTTDIDQQRDDHWTGHDDSLRRYHEANLGIGVYAVDADGGISDAVGVLYEPDGLAGLSPAAKQRLAHLHTAIPSLQWAPSDGRMGAAELLAREGLL